MWEPFDVSASTGGYGYDGKPLKAETHTEGALISLEKDGIAPYSIVFIIYQTLLHTARFESIDDATAAYESMKQKVQDLFEWWDSSVSVDEVVDWCEKFVDMYP